MVPKVLAELRLLASARLDSHILLTVVLPGDGRAFSSASAARSCIFFCLECGARLAPHCPKCQTELPIGAKFCPECGEPLTANPTSRIRPQSAKSG